MTDKDPVTVVSLGAAVVNELTLTGSLDDSSSEFAVVGSVNAKASYTLDSKHRNAGVCVCVVWKKLVDVLRRAVVRAGHD